VLIYVNLTDQKHGLVHRTIGEVVIGNCLEKGGHLKISNKSLAGDWMNRLSFFFFFEQLS